jgi:lipoprotein-anchoring transpeptidase ErfK/SrfK
MKRILLSIAAFLLFLTVASPASADIITSDKMITVDTGKQMLYAWESGRIVHQTRVSTGMNLTPTVKGSFKITRKYPVQDMRGPSPYRNVYPSGKYFIKNVPNVMYFYQGYAIHGAYWHNNFGIRASHGCVNVPLASAQWLFDWAGTGTRVEVF